MNNRTQQRFDRSIREAVAANAASDKQRPRRDMRPLMHLLPDESRKPKGRLLLDPETGATVWEPVQLSGDV